MDLPAYSDPYTTTIGLRCLICNKDAPLPVKTDSVKITGIYSDVMKVLCKYMKWTSPSKYRFDFKNEGFPFCKECVLFVIKLYKLHEQLEETHEEINKVIIGISGKLLLSPRSGKIQGKKQVADEVLNGENCGPIFKDVIETDEKCKYYRNQIYRRFTPSVWLSEQKSGASCSDMWIDYDSEVPEQLLSVQVKIEENPSIAFTNDYEYEYQNLEMSNSNMYYDQNSNIPDDHPSSKSKFGPNSHFYPGLANPLWGVTNFDNEQDSRLLGVYTSGSSYQNMRDGEYLNDNTPILEQQFLAKVQQPVSAIDPLLLNSNETFVDSKSKPNICGICGKAFSSKFSLQRHQFIHTSDQPVCCDLCGISYSSPYNLQTHQRKVHLKITRRVKNISSSYACDICGKTFNQKYNIFRHKLKVHNCTMTPKKLRKKAKARQANCQYDNGMMDTVHTEQYDTVNKTNSGLIFNSENIFECSKCSKSFASSTGLYHHSKVHTKSHRSKVLVDAKSQQFSCDICSQKFSQKFNLNRHKENVHRSKISPIIHTPNTS